MSKYTYRCGMQGCGRGFSTDVGISDYPTCNGEEGSHSRLMDFIGSESKGVPSHVKESHKDRKKEGRWL